MCIRVSKPRQSNGLQVSSVHITFNTEEESQDAAQSGWKRRVGLQYHWENRDYADFDAYLAALKQSRRKSVRQERKSIRQQGLVVTRLRGSQITRRVWEQFFRFYMDTTGPISVWLVLCDGFPGFTCTVISDAVHCLIAVAMLNSPTPLCGARGWLLLPWS
jgi:predicted N-acyltransferase